MNEIDTRIDDTERAHILLVLIEMYLRHNDENTKKLKSFSIPLKYITLQPLSESRDRERSFSELKKITKENVEVWHSENKAKSIEVRINSQKIFESDYKKIIKKIKQTNDTLESIHFIKNKDVLKYAVINNQWNKPYEIRKNDRVWNDLCAIANKESIDAKSSNIYNYFPWNKTNPLTTRYKLTPVRFLKQQEGNIILDNKSGVNLNVITERQFKMKIKSNT